MALRSYQIKLNKPTARFLALKKRDRGQVYAPTGSGKTVCFIELIKEAINCGKKNFVILHPRIALSQDQLRRFKATFKNTVTFTSFHSGAHTKGTEQIREISTTNPNELAKVIDQSINELGKPHITFSSYQSFDKLLTLPDFDIAICDEAHYLVQPQFYQYVELINAHKILFYTATPITDDMEGGMQDYAIFGKVIAAVEPKVLIEPGYILAPLIHQLECVTNKVSLDVDVVDLVARCFANQFKDITSKGLPVHQMIVAARGLEDLREVEDKLAALWTKIKSELPEFKANPDVYTIDSTGSYKNGRPMKSRAAALIEINSCGKNVIVIHYDTLSEGIDIDTLSGALIMRVMSKAKLLQTIGRCARPYLGDLDPVTKEPLKNLYNLKKGIDLRKKPRCIVTLPVIDGKWIANCDGSTIAEAFITGGYGDLMTYMAKGEDNGKGKNKTTFEFDEDGTVDSAIQSHSLSRELENLRKLFDFEA